MHVCVSLQCTNQLGNTELRAKHYRYDTYKDNMQYLEYYKNQGEYMQIFETTITHQQSSSASGQANHPPARDGSLKLHKSCKIRFGTVRGQMGPSP